MPDTADTVIENAVIVTLDAERRVFTNGFLAIRGDRVATVGPMSVGAPPAANRIDAGGKLLLPGIANGHNHLLQNALRGANDERWPMLDLPKAVKALLGTMTPIMAQMDARRAYALSRLHALELTRQGYTATHDEHFTNARNDSADGSWRALAESGLRGYLCRCIVNDRVAEAEKETVAEGLAEVTRLRDRFASDRIIVAGGFLNYSFLADPEDMRRIGQGLAERDIPLDIDMTDNFRGKMLRARGYAGGQVEYYRDFGLLDRPIYAGKAVGVLPHEFDLLKTHDCRVALVPALRFFDGEGLPLHEYFRRDMLPGLGTDAPLVTDCQSPFELMRQSIYAQNIWALRERAETGQAPADDLWAHAERIIEMACLGGNRTLFFEDAGQLAVGSAADCVLIDIGGRAETMPSLGGRRALANLVWSGSAANVDTVFVAGRCLLRGGKSTIWTEAEVIAEAEAAMAEIITEAGLDAVLADRRPGGSFRGWHWV